MSDKTPAVYKAFHDVMLAVQGVAKRDRNTHHNFSFRGIDAVVNAVGPALREHGVIVTPNVTKTEYVPITTSGGRPSTSCRVHVDYIFYAVEDGSSIVTSVVGEATDAQDKATPKAMSVAFRTALLQALALPTDEPDPDSFSPTQETTPMMTANQVSAIQAQISRLGLEGEENADVRANHIRTAFLGEQKDPRTFTAVEAQHYLDYLTAQQPAGVTPEQEAMLSESLGAKPIDDGPNPDEDANT